VQAYVLAMLGLMTEEILKQYLQHNVEPSLNDVFKMVRG
jgi:hypothetical protein